MNVRFDHLKDPVPYIQDTNAPFRGKSLSHNVIIYGAELTVFKKSSKHLT